MITTYKTIIIDDEELARERLKHIITEFPSAFELIGEAYDGDQAYYMIEQLKPDLIFLDIQMPGRNVFKMLAEIKHQPIVIFCTAFDNYALQAFESISIDYILKPIEKERIEFTISKLNHLQKNQNLHKIIKDLIAQETKTYPLSIAHKAGDRIIPVKISEITYFIADNNYVNFYNAECKEYLTEQKLCDLEEILTPDFIRVSKSVLISSLHVKELHKYFRGKYIITLNDVKRTKIESGASYRDFIINRFISR